MKRWIGAALGATLFANWELAILDLPRLVVVGDAAPRSAELPRARKRDCERSTKR